MTFSDGTNNVVLTGVTNTTDLTTVDLSSLSDGPITASITVHRQGQQQRHRERRQHHQGHHGGCRGGGGGDDQRTLAEDGVINNAEKTAVGYTVAGVDGDASATVTFADGTNKVVVSGVGNTTELTTVDLSGLADGPITATIRATDTVGNTATGSGDSSIKDTTADAGAAVAVTINDGDGVISNAEKTAVSYTVAGLDGDASATVTFADAAGNKVVVSGLGNSTFSANLSGLADGPITATITVTDNVSNTATGTGDTITKDTVADAAPTASVTFNERSPKTASSTILRRLQSATRLRGSIPTPQRR